MNAEYQINFTVTKLDERLYRVIVRSTAADYTLIDTRYSAYATVFNDPLGWRVRCFDLDIDVVYPDRDQAIDQLKSLITALVQPTHLGVENMKFHRNSGGWLVVQGEYGEWLVEVCKAPYSPVWVAVARRGNMRINGMGEQLQIATDILLDNVDMVVSKVGAK